MGPDHSTQTARSNTMKIHKFYAIGIFTAILAIAAGPELAMARGGGHGGAGARGGGMNMIQSGSTQQQQYKQQYKHQNRYQYRQESGQAGAQNGMRTGDQTRDRNRDRLRDPATHLPQVSE
jgi:hypothetical protein